PLSEGSRNLLDRFAEDAFAAGRYDFRMGGKLQRHIAAAGFTITEAFTVPDAELSFDGSATAEVLTAWRQRFDRMPRLQALCGTGFERLRTEFLGAIERHDHRSTARVHCVIAKRPSLDSVRRSVGRPE